jgi:hypothetical protein
MSDPGQPAGEELERAGPGRRRRSAAEKILATLRELSRPRPEAAPMELTIATMCLGLEKHLAEMLRDPENDADEWVLTLTRFLASHRSDTHRRLIVVEMPRAPRGLRLPNGSRLRLLDQAEAAAEEPAPPL